MDKLNYTIYLASAIEHSKDAKEAKEDWKKLVKENLSNSLVGIYDPVEREAQKTGKPAGEHVGYVVGLKQGGHWIRFLEEMHKIWWGRIQIKNADKIEILQSLRSRFLIDGNEMRDLDFWGDEEAVIRSNFILAYMEKNVRTVGTIREIHDCYLFNIPVYLIIPDQTKTECNSTLLEMVEESGGKVFYSTNECIKFLKEQYKINMEPKIEEKK